MKTLTKTLAPAIALSFGICTNAFAAYEVKLGSQSLTGVTNEFQLGTGAADDRLGNNVSISGDFAILGATNDDDNGSNSGSAFIYENSGGTWTQHSQLTANDAAVDDVFGNSVDIDGNYAIVGAYQDDDAGTKSGSAYIFFYNGTSWSQQAKLTASDAAASDQFGFSVSISGDYAIVGAIGNDDGGDVSGSAYVFVRSGTSWSEQAELHASDDSATDEFGYSVSIDGDYAVVGAWREDTGGNDSGAAYVYNRSGTTWTEQSKLKASDVAASDAFGSSVDINGSIVVVGARGNDDAGSGSGSSYIYLRSGSTWTEEAKLTASDAAAGDSFGRSVAINNSSVIIGANGVDDNGSTSGAAYTFSRSGTTWSQISKITGTGIGESAHFGIGVALDDLHTIIGSRLDATNAGTAFIYDNSYEGLINSLQADDNFGRAVDIDGDYAIVGTSKTDLNGSNSGSAYIYVKNGSNWDFQAELTASDAAADDEFGSAVSISGNYAVVGSKFDDDDGTKSGSAYIFFFDGATWSQQAKITSSDAIANDRFGSSVSISGDYVIVGADGDDPNGADSGSAYVFKRSGTSWSQEDKFTSSNVSNSDQFGISVSISGDYAVVGAHREDTGGGDAGAAYTFHRSGTTWTQQSILKASDVAASDNFGLKVDIDGDYVVVGAKDNDDDGSSSGSAYIFTRSGSTWSEEAKLTASDADAGDSFGTSVSISGDKVIIGASNNDDDGAESGSAYVFDRDGTLPSWIEKVKLTASDATADDRFGFDVGISGDFVISGAIFQDEFGSDAGAAYIQYNSGGDDPLSVELDTFTARQVRNTIQLTWITASETDNEGFNVYRKAGNASYVQIASYKSHEELLGQGNTTGTTNYTFVDDSELKNNETYTYFVSDVEFSGLETKHTELEQSVFFNVNSEVVRKFELAQNFPNPFNPTTTLQFQVAKDSRVSLKIYNLLGKEIRTLVNDVRVAGNHSVQWDGLNNQNIPVSTGVYFAKIQAGSFSKIVKMSLIK